MPHTPTPARLLSSTARSTFESLALLFAEPLAAPPAGALGQGAPGQGALGQGALGDGAVAARVAFAGHAGGRAVAGALTVAVSADVAAALAESMLGGAGQALGAAERRDAVGEVANVVCGHLVSEAAGPAAVFRLAAPAPAEGDAAARDDAGAPGGWRVWLDVEGGRACVALDAPAELFAAADHAAAAGAAA